jgi:hypothetical protein
MLQINRAQLVAERPRLKAYATRTRRGPIQQRIVALLVDGTEATSEEV